jgi:hypothetical protein
MKISIQDKSKPVRIAVAVDLNTDFTKSYAETMAIRRRQAYRMFEGYIKQLQPKWYTDTMVLVRNQKVAK